VENSVLEQLAALAKIAEIDAEALRSDTELKEIPERMAELDGDVRRLGEMLEAERTELNEADALLAAQEEELQNQNQSLARSKAKGARARNMREADAVERELDVIRRSMKEREEERTTLRGAIEKRRGSVGKHEKELAELQKFAEEEHQKADIRIAELQAIREKVRAGRRELAVKIPADVLRRYDMIRDKRSYGAVPIKNGICGGCNTSVRPNQAVAVRRGETFEQCPRCQRLLFSPEAIKAYEEAKTAAPQPD
jgi:predicted  nucleic acid-binding Zn-ribbon protein